MQWGEAFKVIGKTAERHPDAGVFIGICLLGSVVAGTTHAAWAAVAASLGLGALYSVVRMFGQAQAARLKEEEASRDLQMREDRRKIIADGIEQAKLPFHRSNTRQRPPPE